MIATRGYAANGPKSALEPFSFQRREPGPRDVHIEILFCGVCHSDIHQVRDEWGNSMYPMVPGHEIVGRVERVGSEVERFKAGDLAGVGCMVDSCRKCRGCVESLEQFCEEGMVGTYNSLERDGKTPTYGGYSDCIVVEERFTLKISPKLELAAVAPLLCAGITTYSPLRHWKVGRGSQVGIVGLGGLGHMGVKFARAFGAHVTVFTTSLHKREDALKLGAHEVVLTPQEGSLSARRASLDFLLDTVSAPHDLNGFLGTLKRDGTMVLVGLPEKPPEVEAGQLIVGRKRLAGSMIGGIAETQEMLDFCAEREIVSDIELISFSEVNRAFERMIRGDVKYRFVIDAKTL